MAVYIDTSALVKRYLLEHGSATFDAFLAETDHDLLITPLTLVEVESVWQRRLREGHIDRRFLKRTRGLFDADVINALWQLRPFDHSVFRDAAAFIADPTVPLATLDALHLASALHLGCDAFATADRQLKRAADKRGLLVHLFSE